MYKKMGILMVLMFTVPAFAQNENTDGKAALQTDIQNELACFCGCGMTIQGCLGGMICSESKAVSKEVATLLDQGKNKNEVLQAMIVQYGERILAAPPKEGFNLAAWILPFAALLIGGIIVAKVIAKWKQQTPEQRTPKTQVPAITEKKSTSEDFYSEKLERELRDLDR